MTSLFKWVVNAISSTTNTAAETLLSGIIKKFMEEPIQNDSLSLELFSDWTLHLTIRRSFLDVELINSYVQFMKFKSIYFANVKFDASYNLSNFMISLTRVVIESDAQKIEAPPPIDEDLTNSIHHFQEQLPIEKGKSFKDWIIDCVKKVNITLDHFTIILNLPDENEKISLIIESLNLLYTKDIDLKLPKASLVIGEKRDQRTICVINNLCLDYKNKNAVITIDSITISISESIVKTLFALMQIIIPQNSQTNDNNDNRSGPNMQNSEEDMFQKSQSNNNERLNGQIGVEFILKKLIVEISESLSLEVTQVQMQYKQDSAKMTFDTISILHNKENALSIQSKTKINRPSASLQFPDLLHSKELTMFNNFPKYIHELAKFNSKPFNSLRISVFIPSILVNLSKSLIASIFEVVQWFKPLANLGAPPTTLAVKKSSVIFNLDLCDFSASYNDVNFGLSNASICLFYSQTAANTFINSTIKVHSLDFQFAKNLSLIQFIFNENMAKSCISAIFSYKQQLGNDDEINFDGNLCGFLLRIPSKFDFIQQIMELVPKLEDHSDGNKENIIKKGNGNNLNKFLINENINNNNNNKNSGKYCDDDDDDGDDNDIEAIKPNVRVSYNINVDSIYLDYMTLKMPARAIVGLPSFGANGFVDTAPLQLNTNIKIDDLQLYLSNHRDELPLKIFEKRLFPYAEFNFTPILSLKPTKIMILSNNDSSEVVIEDISLHITCCYDSIRLLIAFIMHIQYKLDNPPEHQTAMKQFDLPKTLLDMTQTLNQSLQLDGFQYNPANENLHRQIVPQQFDTLENMIATTCHQDYDDEDSFVEPEFDDNISINSDEPVSPEKVVISVQHISVVLGFFGGKDFDQIYNLKPMQQMPLITNGYTESDFDFITTRDESNSIEVQLEGNIRVSMYDKDPAVSVRVIFAANKFNVSDYIQTSDARYILGIDDNDDRPIKCKIDILSTSTNRMELSFKLELPNLFVFITQDQIKFFMNSVQINIPTFPSDLIVDEPLAFQLFELKPSDLQIIAHFRLWLDIHMDDIKLHVPKCQLFAVRGFDELIGGLAEFYVSEINKPGAAAVVGGLPVIKNIRRIAGGVRDLFTYDVQKYGVGIGFAKSFSALMQIIAMETLNMGANATNIAERFLFVAMKFLGGKDNAKEAIETGMATLIVQADNPKKVVKNIPTMILAPGVLSLKKLTDMMKNLRDRVNPNYAKTMKYRKEKK